MLSHSISVVQQATRTVAEERETSLLDRPVLLLAGWDWEKTAYVALVLLAGLLRFWDLGARALHHDESLHALYSWYLYEGRGYQHDPLMHGPFQFHGVALIFFLLGASDYTARVLPALLGTATVVLPYFLRERLGRWGALFTAVLLACSPSMLYYSRFVRNDIYIVFWDLVLVIGMWRFLQGGRASGLLAAAVALSLGFATKEVTYLTVLIFASYLLVTSWRELLSRIRQRFDFRGVSHRAGLLIAIVSLVLPLGAAGVLVVLDKLGVDRVAWGANPESLRFLIAGSDPGKTFFLVAGTVAPLGLLGAALARRWDLKLWLPAAAAFYGIFAVLYTTFFTHLPGLGSGLWGSLEYWLAQHDVQRGSQPWFYYLVLLPLYEFLPLLLFSGGAVYFGYVRRFQDEFAGFLIWWAAGSLLLYSYAGEKMPWLSLHSTLPVILLAGKTLGVVVEGVSWRELLKKGGLYLALVALLIPLALRALLTTGDPFEEGPGQTLRLLQALAAAAALAFLLGTAWQLVQGSGEKLATQTVLLLGLVVLGGLTLRAAWQASYFHGDIPVEVMVYTQTSPEVPRIMREIERVAAESGQGKNLPITVDAADGFTWPWAWYLRDYKNVDYPNLAAAQGEPRGTVLLLNANNQKTLEPFLAKYEQGQRFPHRWWFPENYDLGLPRTPAFKNLGERWDFVARTLGAFWADLTNGDNWASKWRYFLYRNVGAPLGSSDALVYYPKGYGRGLGLGALQTPPPPIPVEVLPQPIQVQSELILGGSGLPGALGSPKGLAVDLQGNVYVVDSRAAQVTKFDPSGRVLAQVGRSGAGDGEFTEPWGIALDRNGNLYVADTWNHRIQKFDAELRFITKWGSFASVSASPQNPGSFWGPRDLAVDGEGNLYVADTGNKRVQKFSPTGQFLGAFGEGGRGRVQFQEPVGIEISPLGEILVADTWNRRVQRFDKDFRYVGEFPVAGWTGQGVLNKPYMAVDQQGNILVSDPESHRLLQYSSTGVLLKVFGRFGSDRSSFNLPAAVALDAQGNVYVSDSGNSRVLRFPPLQ